MASLMIPPTRWIEGSGFRCIACRRDADKLIDAYFIEPKDADCSAAMFLRGWICDDCLAVHWAAAVVEGGPAFDPGPLLREAAARICVHCAEGWEVACGREEGKPDLWYHPTRRDRGGATFCTAGPIHALRPR